MVILKDDFGCSTIQEAEDALKGMDAKADKAEAAYTKIKAKFEEDWDAQLGSD